MANHKLPLEFYLREDVLQIGKDLLGMVLCTNFKGQFTAGKIVETEAYRGVVDKASHAYSNRRTKRTETMYAQGGVSYVYLCYGIHHLFNIVTNQKEVPHAILIRAVEPLDGIAIMQQRRKQAHLKPNLTAGPGVMSQALGITTTADGISLLQKDIWVEDRGLQIPNSAILAGPRIGVDYAGEDALLPYRFSEKGSKWVSKAK